MTSLPNRQQLVKWFEEATATGARKAKVCAKLGISLRTIQRWTVTKEMKEDARSGRQRCIEIDAF
jgi:putative transposase